MDRIIIKCNFLDDVNFILFILRLLSNLIVKILFISSGVPGFCACRIKNETMDIFCGLGGVSVQYPSTDGQPNAGAIHDRTSPPLL